MDNVSSNVMDVCIVVMPSGRSKLSVSSVIKNYTTISLEINWETYGK